MSPTNPAPLPNLIQVPGGTVSGKVLHTPAFTQFHAAMYDSASLRKWREGPFATPAEAQTYIDTVLAAYIPTSPGA